MSQAVLLLLAVVFAGVALFAIDAVMRKPVRGVWMVLGLEASSQLVPEDFGVDLIGFRVAVGDVALVLMSIVVASWFMRGRRPTTSVRLVVAALALALWSVARGVVEYGMAAGINEARQFLYFLLAVLFAAGLKADVEMRREIVRAWMWFCGFLLLVALARWAIVLGGLPGRGFWYSPEYAGLRVLWSDEALALVQMALMLLPRIARGIAEPWEIRVATAAGLGALVLQHRSVWAVGLVGGLVVLWRCRRDMSRRLVAVAGIAMVAMLAVTVTIIDSGEVVQDAGRADAVKTGTFEWRVAGWRVLAASAGPRGPVELITGRAYGGGWERTLDDGATTDAPPHNMYLETLLRVGLAGMVLLIVVGIRSARRLLRRPDDGHLLDSTALLTILASQAVYAIPYNLSVAQGLLYGFVLAVLAQPAERRTIDEGALPVAVSA